MSRARQGEEAEWASVDEPNAAIGIETRRGRGFGEGSVSRARQGEEADWASVDEPNAAIGIETRRN